MEIFGEVLALDTLPVAAGNISHHNPIWTDAMVRSGEDTVVIRFSDSTDVMWYKSPKLTVGMKGVFTVETVDGVNMLRSVVEQ
jgi:hypothetical protein